ncbi:hypothetical protein LF41_266 [Lysobacter dokdonensis DS-58]|uniref:Uncharacterized protein n=1 Tax=Lysobacter dokdonensis DS-58 TaxID=1300345 RepID=A0A0A2WG27_9GAMM|nr:hypothetical protein LF41_266 [Lysobacter dokdonensis DS-58]
MIVLPSRAGEAWESVALSFCLPSLLKWHFSVAPQNAVASR